LIRKIKRIKSLAILIALSLILPGKVALAALPSTYQLGLSTVKVDELTGNGITDETGTIYARDYRDMEGAGRTDEEEKPTAQFEILSNGKVVATSDADKNLDAPTVVTELNINDVLTIKDKSKASKGNLCLWDLQYRSDLTKRPGDRFRFCVNRPPRDVE